MLPSNNNGMAVDPMFAQGAKFGNSSPPTMSYANGGPVPEDEDEDRLGDALTTFDTFEARSPSRGYATLDEQDNADAGRWRRPVGRSNGMEPTDPPKAIPEGDDGTDYVDASDPDETTKAVSNALKTVNSVLMYGRQKHGLPTDEEDGEKEMSFEDGGAIPDDEEFNDAAPEGGAEPVWYGEGAGEGGAEPAFNREAAPEGGAIPEEDMSGVTAPTDDASLRKPQDMAPVPEAKKQSTPLQYLMGAEAIDAARGDRIMKMAGNDAAKAIDLMVRGENGDGRAPDYGAGWAMAQYNRRKYDLYQNHARAAVDNGDYQNAANSIMKAFENVPDGQTVRAKPAQDGIELTVFDDNGKALSTEQLSKEQLDQLTNTGKAGQFDAVIKAGGAAGVLQSLQSGAGHVGVLPAGAMEKFRGQVEASSGVGRYGRDPLTGKNFTEGNRPSTPSEIQDMARMRREDPKWMPQYSIGMNARTPDPRAPLAGANGVVSFPGYKVYQQKYAGGANTDGGPDTQPRTGGSPVNVISGADGNKDRQYINGVDQTPSEQEKKLELIRARNEGRETGDKKLERETLKQDRTDARQKAAAESRTKHDEAINARRAASGDSSAARAQRALEYRVAGERLKLKKEGFKDEQIDQMIAATYGKAQQTAPTVAGPAAPAAPQASAPTVVQTPSDAQKLAPGTVYMTPDGRKFTR